MLEICNNMRYSLILFLISSAFCQSDFIKPSDFNENPPKFPTVKKVTIIEITIPAIPK